MMSLNENWGNSEGISVKGGQDGGAVGGFAADTKYLFSSSGSQTGGLRSVESVRPR